MIVQDYQTEAELFRHWLVAYATVAGVTATLSGLLFVSLSVKLNIASADERHRIMFLAQRSFIDFLAVLVLALLFLMPTAPLHAIGLTQIAVSLARFIWHFHHWRATRLEAAVGAAHPWNVFVSVCATLLLAVAGIAVLFAWSFAEELTYLAVVALLFGACRNAWRLLVR